jgi:hypothetical protein
MENPQLQVAVNLKTKALDPLVLKWAFSTKIISSTAEVERYKRERINYFAGYLFPELSAVKLEWIMKMFFWLFVLDDHLDNSPPSESRTLIWALRTNRLFNYYSPYSNFFRSWSTLIHSSPGKDDPDWQAGWDLHWSTFLNGIEWELNNKYQRLIPDLKEYKYYRPHLSGVFLALHYLKLDLKFVSSCTSDLLESKIARWICLCNDLISADKEQSAGDFHNELFLLSRIVSKREAKKQVEKEITMLHRHIQHLGNEVLRQSQEYKDWISRLNLLMGGCAYWSNEVTVRYESYLNGTIKN